MIRQKRQRGAVLILLFVALIMSAATVILAGLNNASTQTRDRVNKQNELRKIKETLLAYARQNPEIEGVSPNGPGRLPCSDRTNDGVMDCDNNAGPRLGRLPEIVNTSVGGAIFFSDHYVGTGQQFWYAVGRDFRQSFAVLNTESAAPNPFTLDGSGSIAAVIIAPGPSLDGQVRLNLTQAAQYLESTNTTGPNFVSRHPTDPRLFNDIVATITVAEVMTVATSRVAQEIKRVIEAYHPANAATYPPDQAAFTAEMGSNGAAWIGDNAWMGASLQAYTLASADLASVQFTNCAIVYTFAFGQDGFTRSPLSC